MSNDIKAVAHFIWTKPSGPGVQLVTSEEGDVVAVHMSQANSFGAAWGLLWCFLVSICLLFFSRILKRSNK